MSCCCPAVISPTRILHVEGVDGTHEQDALFVYLTYFNGCDHSPLHYLQHVYCFEIMFLSTMSLNLKFRLFSFLSQNKTKPMERASSSHGPGGIWQAKKGRQNFGTHEEYETQSFPNFCI